MDSWGAIIDLFWGDPMVFSMLGHKLGEVTLTDEALDLVLELLTIISMMAVVIMELTILPSTVVSWVSFH